MKIDRSQLISDLLLFSLNGSGLVVGQPGVGKSYALVELREHLKFNGIPHLILPVERLGEASESDLKAILGREGDLVSLLGSFPKRSDTPAILLFDGFDAARGESQGAGVYRLIRKAVCELRGQWNTIVSVRSFDAKKSRRLLELFPVTEADSGGAVGQCRQFLIPTLRVNEVDQALTQIPGLRALHDRGTEAFRGLLTVPFNLWIIERIIAAGAKACEFSQITSEVQLLEMYWTNRVRLAPDPADREFTLKSICQAMVEAHALTVRRERIYKPEVRDAWQGLLSDEILTEVVGLEARVAFTHNILFDFAVSAHLLDSEPNKLAGFVAEDPSRPLFLRPSLVYHFTRLWHFNRNGFWRNFWAVVQREELHLRQIVRLVLPAVVVSEAQMQEDLAPLVTRLSAQQASAVEATAFLLQALRVLKSPREALWAEFLRSISQYLDRGFAWDAGVIAMGIIESQRQVAERTASDCGELGRRLLSWAWDSRRVAESRHWFERLTGMIAIPLVARTFATNSEEARYLLRLVVYSVGDSGFPVDCIYRLTNEVKHLIPHDPEFVGFVYERVFGYDEQSDEKTHMGGVVMPLMSNRRQDYEMCRYCLIREFRSFLESATLTALQAGIRAIQAFVLQSRVLHHSEDGKTFDDLGLEFRFRNAVARYVQDGSAIWDESSYPDPELQIADTIFEWLASAVKADRTTAVTQFIDAFGCEARMGFLWSRLLAVGAEFPRVLGPCLWELAIAKPVMESTDSLFALGTFLERAFEHLAESERRQIEDAILGLGRAGDADRKEWLRRRRDRLLARIPPNHLLTMEGMHLRRALEQENRLPANSPPFTVSSSWNPITEDEILSRQGANLESPGNAMIRNLYRPLKEWREQNRDEAKIDDLLPTAGAVMDLLSSVGTAEPVVLRAASMQLAGFASEALLKTRDSTTLRFQTLRRLVLLAVDSPDPESNAERDSEWDSPMWSPAPRNDAAQALPWLTHFGRDTEAMAAIQKLACDPVPSVRFLLVCELWRAFENYSDEMWSVFDDLAAREDNGVVLQGITVSLWKLIHRDPVKSQALIRRLLTRLGEETDDDAKARTALICMLVDYAVWFDDPWAKQELSRWQQDAVGFSASVSVAGRRLIEHIKPQHSGEQLVRARALLLDSLNSVAIGLGSLREQAPNTPEDEFQRNWRRLYGVIDDAVTRIYFSADINSSLRQRKEHPLTNESRLRFFRDAQPILERVLSFGNQPETGMLLAPTAHHFMKLLNGILPYDPGLALRMAAEVVTCSRRFNYTLDSMAMSETVELVESILADHRETVQEEAPLKSLLELLDAFVEAGWPEALNLVWRLDEIYR